MSELQIYEKMSHGLRGDIKAMEEESKTIDMAKHPYFSDTLASAKAELSNCEKQIEELRG